MTKVTSIRLSDDLAEKLDNLAASVDRPRAWLIEQAIAGYVAEEAWQVEAIDEAVASYRAGTMQLVPHAEVMGRLDEKIATRAGLVRLAQNVVGSLEEVDTPGWETSDSAAKWVHGIRQPILAESVPSRESGLLRLSPSGQVEQKWKIGPGVEWHDGHAFSADDLVFASTVGQDPNLPEFRAGAEGSYALVERVEAIDPLTVAVTWRSPFIKADRIFSTGSEGFAAPLPSKYLDVDPHENYASGGGLLAETGARC